jgi:hypothetical protein
MKIRIDPSSAGQRLFSCYADFFDSLQADKVMLSKMFKLFSERLSFGEVYWVNLEEVDFFKRNKWNDFTYPEIEGVLADGSNVEVSRVEDSSQFTAGPPTRIESKGSEEIVSVLWSSSSPNFYGNIVNSCRLGITVTGSDHYKRRSNDRGFPGYHLIEVRGLDENNNYITESIFIRDDGSFKTKKIFKSITSIKHDGFNGSILVFAEEMFLTSLLDPFHTGVTVDKQRPLYLRGFQESSGLVGIELLVRQFLNGRSYRFLNNLEAYEENDLEEVLDNQIMIDESGTPYSVVDYTISPIDARIWCLSADGRIHIHDNSIVEFEIPPEKEDSTSALDLIPDVRRIAYNEDVYLYTFFRALRGPLKEYKIRRIDPDGIENYLQSDKVTWAATPHSFSGNWEQATLPEDTHDTMRFYSTIDKLGEWHFYCDATLLIRGSSGITETTRAGVLCSSNTAIRSYSTGLTNVAKLYFSKQNHLTVVTDLNSSTCVENYYKLYNDVYMPDVRNNRILLREPYEDIEVNYV